MKAESGGVEKVCEPHQEPLKLFCKDEKKLMCVTCGESKDLAAVEEAVQGYKEELETQLQAWREKRETAISFHTKEKDKCQKLFLEEFVKEEEKFIAKLSTEVLVMDAMIYELEEKSRHPEKAFLQDVEKTFSRSEEWESQHPDVCFELEEKLHAFSKKYIILKETLHVFTEYLPGQLKVEWANVTLDPDTAHRLLQVSGGQKILKWTWTDVTDCPQRFSSSSCVLGCEAFISGRHYWEVKVGDCNWAVGVAREAVTRKESISLTPEEGIWAVEKANTNLKLGGLVLKCSVPKTVGVYLDYEGNRLMFFDAEKKIAIGSCPASFKAEKIRPFFSLNLSWKNEEDRWLQLCS